MSLPSIDAKPPSAAVKVIGRSTGACPLIYACPHAGRHYPAALLSATALDHLAIRKSEDAFVDDLLKPSSRSGLPLVVASYARAFIDVNRGPYELDPTMFEDALPAFARTPSSRVAAGLGSVARIVSEGQEIYHKKLTVSDALARIDTIHRPYHAALDALISETRRRLGCAVLIDWHSMPSSAISPRGAVDVIIGDRFGASCSPRLVDIFERQLRDLGFSVGRNTPFAGGYTTEHYGRPRSGVHAIQIEINRGLYLNEASVTPGAGYDAIKTAVTDFSKRLKRLDWRSLAVFLSERDDKRIAGE